MIGDKLRKLRTERGITSDELCNCLGIKGGSYRNYERNDRKPDYDILCKLADFYGVSTDYLLGRSDNASDDIDPVEQLPVSLQDKAIVQAYINLPEKERSQLVGILRKIAEGADLSISLDGVEAVLKPPPEAEQNAQPLSEQPPEN